MTGLRGGWQWCVGVLVALAFVGVVAPAAGAENLLGNPGFEDATLGTQRGYAVNEGQDENWLAFANTNGTFPSVTTDQVHSGSRSGVVTTPSGAQTDGYWVQDVGGFNPNQGYEFDVWINPQSGTQQQASLLFNWPRKGPTSLSSADIFVRRSSITFDAWGQSMTVDSNTFGAWHEYRLVANGDTLTSELFVDGASVGKITTPGSGVAAGATTTVILGQGIAGNEVSDRYLYDDVSLSQLAGSLVVNTADDHDDGACTATDCTLREAINAANATSGADTITFAIGSGPQTINLDSVLPQLTDSVTIDATTQPGWQGPPIIELNGPDTGGTRIGFDLEAPNSIVKGFVIHSFTIGVRMGGDNGQLADSYVGTDTTGTQVRPNTIGVDVGSDSNTIGGAAGEGNVISGNLHPEISITGNGNRVLGNLIGTNAAGNDGLGGSADGIQLIGAGSDNRIGGTVPGAGNTISGNANAVWVQHSGPVTIVGNQIGTTADGTDPVGNSGSGVFALNTSGITVGGAGSAGNLIVGNGSGVALAGGTTDAVVSGNTIRANSGDGVAVNGPTGAVIGGTTDGAGNTIVGNGAVGVEVQDGQAAIEGNSISGQDGLGIDLDPVGPTPNDADDSDTGPNGLQNFPVSITASRAGGTIRASAKLVSAPGAAYRIEAFLNSACDGSGFGEGATFLGATTVTTTTSGEAGISMSLPFTGDVPDGAVLTMTATDPGGNTSEFSSCAPIGAGGTATDASIAIASGAQSAEMGAELVPQKNIPLSALQPTTDAQGNTQASPLAAVPLAAVPLAAVNLSSSPLAAVPLAAVGLTPDALRQNALGGVPLSTIPLDPPLSWTTVLASTPLAGVPLNTITLADAIAANPAALSSGQIQVKDVGLGSSPLAAVPLAAVALGATPLAAVPINGKTGAAGLAEWCAAMNGKDGFTCTAASLQGVTVMSAALNGAPLAAVPLAAVPLAAVDLSASPLAAVPLAAVTIQGSPLAAVPLAAVNLSVSPLAAVPIADIADPTKVVVCGAFVCAGKTIGDAFAANALVPGATIADMGTKYTGVNLGNIGKGLPPNITLQDLFALLLGQSTAFDYEHMSLAGIQDFVDAKSPHGQVTYTATFTVVGTGVGPADVTVKLSDDGRYVAHTAALSIATAPQPAPAEPDQTADGTITFHLEGLAYGTAYRLAFQVRPGLDLGTETATASITAPGIDPKAAPTPVQIPIHDSFESNNTLDTATQIAKDTLVLSHPASGKDVDWYSLPIPPVGTQVRIFLSHLTSDDDLAVLGPAEQPLRSAPLAAVPLAAVQMGDTAAGLQQRGEALTAGQLDDSAAQLVASGQLAVLGSSDNRRTSDEEVDLTSAGQSGVYRIAVSSYDGTPSEQPYMLRVEETPPPTLPPCPARTFPHAGEGTVGALPAPASIPTTTQTIILVNEKRIGDTYGAAAEQALVAKLQSFAARTDVQGVILPVDGDADTAAAYGTWDADPCSPAKANDVVRAIGAILDRIRTQTASAKYLVIAGGDDIVPMARRSDGTSLANESTFYSSFPFSLNDEYIGAVANGYLLTDDPYGDPDPAPFLGGQLYVPKLGLGRLVETPADISAQIDQYVAANGAINPQSELTTGYDFLSDGATAVEAGLKKTIPTGSDLINDTWTHQNLLDSLFPSGAGPVVDSVNAHYDQYRALPAIGSTTHDESDLFTSGEVAARGAAAVKGRLIFTMGCHSGFALFDLLFNDPSLPTGFALDWPQAYAEAGAAGYMGNTGFGLGDDAAVAYSEKLNQLFAERLDGSMTVGQALSFAKQEYFGQLGVISLYDAKVGNEATFYGLPMYKLGTGTPPVPPAAPITTTDGATGLQVASFSTTPSFTLVDRGARGQYYTINGGAQVTNRRPIQPSTNIDVTEPGLVAHGAVLTALASTDTSNFHVVFSRVVADLAANEPQLQGQVSFPAKPQAIATLQTPAGQQQRLVLIAGHFLSNDGTPDVGTQRRYTRLDSRVYFSNNPDYVEPTLTGMQVLKVGSSVGFAVDVHDFTNTGADGTVKAAVVLYLDGSGAWRRADLGCSNGRCTGAGPLTGNQLEYFAQAVDAAGNVGVTSGKSVPSDVVPPKSTGHITLTPDGTLKNGWYTGPVRVTATSDTGGVDITFSVDGSAFKDYSGPFTVSGDGVHTVEARGSDGSDAFLVVPIDVTGPTISLTTPVNGAVFLAGDNVLADFACQDGGSGIASCVGTKQAGQAIDTTEGSHKFTVTATDRVGNTSSVTVTYNVWPFKGFLFPVKNPPTFNLAPAGIIVPFIFSVGGNRGMNIFEAGYPKSQQIPCGASSDVVGMDTTNSFAGLGLIFIPVVNQYVYLWKTDRSWAGTCRQFVIKFPNGSFRRANFKFK